MLSSRLILLAAGLTLFGCAGESRPTTTVAATSRPDSAAPSADRSQSAEYQRILQELHRASECVGTAEGRPEFTPLLARASNGAGGDAYPRHFLDKSRATAAEGPLIDRYLAAIKPCQPAFGVMTLPSHQSITRMIDGTWRQQQALYHQLKGGQISWGQFNRDTASNADRLTGALQALKLTNEG
jgi:hypothetical protein